VKQDKTKLMTKVPCKQLAGSTNNTNNNLAPLKESSSSNANVLLNDANKVRASNLINKQSQTLKKESRWICEELPSNKKSFCEQIKLQYHFLTLELAAVNAAYSDRIKQVSQIDAKIRQTRDAIRILIDFL
jgi:hypothetical protein